MPKLAIFGQAVSYTGSESNYCQKWKKLSQNIAKTGNIWTKLVQVWMQKVPKNGKKTLNKSCQFWELNIPGLRWVQPFAKIAN